MFISIVHRVKGTKIGPLLVLVCPCFQRNVIATCKIVSFLCNLDNFLLKNVTIFFSGNQISKWRSSEKKNTLFLAYFSHFSHQGKTHKFLQHISHPHTCTYFAHPINFLSLTNFTKITNLSCMVSLWCDSWCWFFFTPFWNNQSITKWWSKFRLECLLLIFI